MALGPLAVTKQARPFEASFRHEIWIFDVRYLDHSLPETGNVYVVAILENYPRAILASAVTLIQDTNAYLSVLHAAIGRYGLPKIVTDGGVFRPDRAKAVYRALGVEKEEIERGQPWQSFIETDFSNVQRRMADHFFARAESPRNCSRSTTCGWSATTARGTRPTKTGRADDAALTRSSAWRGWCATTPWTSGARSSRAGSSGGSTAVSTRALTWTARSTAKLPRLGWTARSCSCRCWRGVPDAVSPAVVELLRVRGDARVVWREGAGLSEYWQFGLFMVFILAILAASYGFIIMAPSAPNREQKERQSERESEAD